MNRTSVNQTSSFESLDEIQTWVLSSLLREGSPVTSRGMPTLEVFPVSFSLTHPRRRCITNPERRWNLPLAIGEFCWHTTGSNDLRFIEYYAPRWKEFTDGIEIIGSCYGHHIFGRKDGQPSQWARLVRLLRAERHSRRAVLQLFEPQTGLDAETKDAPCTCTIQFLVRNDQLHAIVYMRSNDAIWGLPYDIFLFTMLQELLALELGTELGSYFHLVGSLHLYKRHFELAKRIVSCESSFPHEMPPMREHQQLASFLALEQKVRAGMPVDAEMVALDPYWSGLLDVLKWNSQKKQCTAQTVQVPVEPDYAALLRSIPPVRTTSAEEPGTTDSPSRVTRKFA
jgi:thymidylate synthase